MPHVEGGFCFQISAKHYTLFLHVLNRLSILNWKSGEQSMSAFELVLGAKDLNNLGLNVVGSPNPNLEHCFDQRIKNKGHMFHSFEPIGKAYIFGFHFNLVGFS